MQSTEKNKKIRYREGRMCLHIYGKMVFNSYGKKQVKRI